MAVNHTGYQEADMGEGTGMCARNRRPGSRESVFYGAMDSPLGTLYVALDGKNVVSLGFAEVNEREFCRSLASQTSRSIRRADDMTKCIMDELREYFDGTRKRFSHAPDLSGCTAFQQEVLAAAVGIPYGQTRTYGWLAAAVGRPAAARAVGQAMARNPVPIIIPCHRVIGSTGSLCGFGGGARRLDLKQKLLETEGVEV